MKKLLVPTDFSANAANALEYAVQLANTFGSEITLLNTYRLYQSAGMLLSVEEYVRSDAEKEMAKLERQFQDRLRNGAILRPRIVRGDAVTTITGGAKAENMDLIIMGTQGAGGLKEVFLGSTTNGVIQNTELPVLAIPNAYQGRPPLRVIVLAIDAGSLSHPDILSPLVQLARAFDAKVRIYHKDTGADDAGVDPTVDLFLEGVEHSFHYELDSDKLNESIRQFVADYQGDLLCMVHRSRGFLSELFHVSVTTREVFDCSIPLMVLHDRAD